MESLKKFTDFLNDLKIIESKKSIGFPRVAILGSSNSGKSSLIHCILGINLFPNGANHKLSHLEINLRTTETTAGYTFELQNTRERFSDIDLFRRRLNEHISTLSDSYEDSVTITVSSPDLPYMTLIDLPGFIELGANNTDDNTLIQESIKKKAVKRIIKDEKVVLVCVHAAGDNLSESQALDYAREYDPQGERTMGVLTKYDLLETNGKRGEIVRILNGKDFPLKHGYLSINPTTAFRSSLSEGEGSEKSNSAHPIYSKRRSPEIEDLLTKIKKVFCFSTRAIFPSMLNEFQAKGKEYERELDELGEDLDVGNANIFQILWKTASNFCLSFRDALSGTYTGLQKTRTKKMTLACGAYIRNLLHGLYMDTDYINIFQEFSYSDEEIEEVLKHHNTVSLEGFITSTAFKMLVCDRLKVLEEPTYEIFQKIYEALAQTSKTLLIKHFARLPELRVILEEYLGNYFAKEKNKTLELLKPMIQAQLYYVYCNDPERIFQNVYKLIKANSDPNKPLSKDEVTNMIIHELKESCKVYCENVMYSLRDCIPKMIGQFFLDEVANNIHILLTEHIKNVITENPDVLKLSQEQKARRIALTSKLTVIGKFKQYILKDAVLYQLLRDPNLEENLYNQYQKKKDSYFKRVEETALRLERKRKAQQEPEKKTRPKKNWSKELKNWIQQKKSRRRTTIFGLDSTVKGQPNQQQQQQKQISRIHAVNSLLIEEEMFMVTATRPRANSVDLMGSSQKVNRNALITDFVMIDNYWDTDQQAQQGKIFSKTDWMRMVSKGDIEGIPHERLVISLQHGIPSEVRPSVWTILAQVKKLKSEHPKFLYERLCQMSSKWDTLIAKDVPRTRGDDPFFRKPEYRAAERLTKVLKAYASYDPELGYTQGMNEIVGILLRVMANYGVTNQYQDTVRVPKSCDKNTFWILVYIMKVKGYRDSFKDSCPKLIENTMQFENLLREEHSDVVDHMEASGVTVYAAFTHLFMTLCCQFTPDEFSVRIIDTFLLSGEKVLFDVLLKVVEVCRKEIFSLKDDKLFKFFKREIMRVCFEKYQKELNKVLPNS